MRRRLPAAVVLVAATVLSGCTRNRPFAHPATTKPGIAVLTAYRLALREQPNLVIVPDRPVRRPKPPDPPPAATFRPARQRPVTVHANGPAGHHGYPTAVACVEMTENGGSYGRSTNPTHSGRYQFDRGTWQAYGGNPATWGSATPAEQDAVFYRAVAAGGLWQGWLRWDGC